MLRNQIQIVGNVGKAPEKTAQTKDGKAVVRFAIAQDVNGMDAATQKLVKKDPQWFQVSCFAGVAERALVLMKGDLVLVSGELKSRTYQGESGDKRTSVEIVAQEILRVTRLRRLADDRDISGDSPGAGSDFANFSEGDSFV